MYNETLLRQVNHSLDILRSLCNARLVFLAYQDGQIISVSGKMDEINIHWISDTYTNALFSLLNQSEKIDVESKANQLIYRESNSLHIFVSNIGCELALFVISNHSQINQRLGTIWNYVQKISRDLQKDIGKPVQSISKNAIPTNFVTEIDRELDNLFSTDKDQLT